MATKTEVYQNLLNFLTDGTIDIGYEIAFGEGWPNEAQLQKASTGSQILGSIVDFDEGQRAVRWIRPEVVSRVLNSVGITSTVGNSSIDGVSSQTITLGGTVNVNDAISCTVGYTSLIVSSTQSTQSYGDSATATAVTGDTLATMATKLAAAINAKVPLNTLVTAAAVGSVVTVTNTLTTPVLLLSRTGQRSDIYRSVGRMRRLVQVTIWANSVIKRDAAANPSEVILWNLDAGDGYQNSDGTFTSVKVMKDRNDYSDMSKNIYARHFRLHLEHSITVLDHEYAVLATERTQTQTFY